MRLKLHWMFVAGVAGLVWSSSLMAQGPVPYDPAAAWESYPSGVATGGGFVDLDRDGDLDLVVANGNDIARQRVEVFSNDGLGGFPENPQWESSDIDYHGHLAIGDVDGDGWPDVAVSVFLGPGGFGSPGHVKLYLNDGAGQLSSTPAWRSDDDFYTFSCAFGDADGDGDLDLAVATGEPYGDLPDRNRIYFNDGGVLLRQPGWLSATADHALDVTFGDPDGDGDLDLAFTLTGGSNEIYFQGPAGIETSPGWVATDSFSQFGNTLAFRDLDGDGWLELGVSDNNQIGGGAGVFKVYRNLGGALDTIPVWQTTFGFTSAVAFADLHLDGFPDLAGGIWFAGNRVFLNDSGVLATSPDWSSQQPSVVEAIFFGDVDGDGLRRAVGEDHAVDGLRRVFYLDHPPVREIGSVVVDGVELDRTSYSWDIQDGWLALDRAPAVSLEVDYDYSEALDMGVTNWDGSRGSYIFLRHPLVEVTTVPPPDPTLEEGEVLEFSVHLGGTTNREEVFTYGLAVQSPSGSRVFPDVHQETLAPFGSRKLDYSIPLPVGLPPEAFGEYRVTAVAVEEGVVTDRAGFVFEFVAAP